MRYSLKKLLAWLTIACLIALLIGNHINSPERRVRLAGIDYNPNRKGGDFLHSPNGSEFDDNKLAEIVEIAADFSKPHGILLTGDNVTDDGFKVFQSAPNIYSISLKNMTVSNSILDYLDEMPDLVYLSIENCPHLDERTIHRFRLANSRINVVSK